MTFSVFSQAVEPFFKTYRDNPDVNGGLYQEDYDAIWAMPLNNAYANLETSAFNAEAMTITSWVAPVQGDNYREIVFKGDRGLNEQKVDFKFGFYGMVLEFGYLNNQGEWRGLLRNHSDLVTPDGQTRRPLSECPQAIPNHWNFCAVTFDHGYIRLFMNGEIVAEGRAAEQSLVIANTPLLIGNGQNIGGAPNAFLNGLLSNVQIFNCALSPENVEAVRQSQITQYSTEPLTIKHLRELYANEYDPQYKRKLKLTEAYETDIPECELPENGSEYYMMDVNGIPRLARDGVPESGMCMMPFCGADNTGVFNSVRDFAAAGTNYVSEIFWPWITWGDSCSKWWLSPGNYDFPKIEARIQKIVEGNPSARIIVRIKMNVPDWWLEKYPEELGIMSDGKPTAQPSMASVRWMDDVNQMLYDVAYHLEHSQYARNIAGYLVAGGETSEWFWWGWSTGKIDYSPIAETAFRKWLAKKYDYNEALQYAWNDVGVTLENAKVPSVEERWKIGKDGIFTPVEIRERIHDYRRFLSDMTSDCIIKAVKRLREALPVRKLIGTFYGYSMYMDHNALGNLGFQNLKEVLECKDVDFLCAPMTYITRRGGEEGNFICEYTASLRLHGKLYWDEADMRTHLYQSEINCATLTPDETSEVNWRTFGNSLVQGTNIWWFLIAGNAVFHSERIMTEISQMARLDQELLNVPRTRSAQIAVIGDEKSMEYAIGTPYLDKYTIHTLQMMPKIGTPYDTYLMSDLENEKMPDYHLYIFLNAYYMTNEMRENIHKKLARNHAAALWVYAPGYLSPDGNSTETMNRLTGLKFTEDFSQEHITFTTEEPSAENEWGTSYYHCGALNPDFIRGICKKEGIHLYIESNDILRGNASFIMVHATKQGRKTLTFPQAIALKNLKTGELLSPNTSFQFYLRHGETALFQILPSEEMK